MKFLLFVAAAFSSDSM